MNISLPQPLCYARRNRLASQHFHPHNREAGLPDMTINAHAISGLDPGAVPGGSTIIAQISFQSGFDGAEIGSTDV